MYGPHDNTYMIHVALRGHSVWLAWYSEKLKHFQNTRFHFTHRESHLKIPLEILQIIAVVQIFHGLLYIYNEARMV